MRSRVTAIVVSIFLSALAIRADGDAVKVRTAVSVDKVKQGAPFQAAVILEIVPGYHINSNVPSEDYLIPTKVELSKLNGVTFGPVSYPAAETRKFSYSDKPLDVYEEKAVMKFTVRPTGLPVGKHVIRAKVTYQACNDQACLAPQTVAVEIPIEVVDAKQTVKQINQDIFPPARKK